MKQNIFIWRKKVFFVFFFRWKIFHLVNIFFVAHLAEKNFRQAREDILPTPLKEGHTRVRKHAVERTRHGVSKFSWSQKRWGENGWDSFGEEGGGESGEKTATDIINFFAQENWEKVALCSHFGVYLAAQELLRAPCANTSW